MTVIYSVRYPSQEGRVLEARGFRVFSSHERVLATTLRKEITGKSVGETL